MPNQDQSRTQLHLTFVEMLFALAIGQIAVDLSKLIDYQLMSTQTLWSVVPAYSHLSLAFVVISTSWVGWRNSRFCGTQIKDVFTLDYIELALDIVLVFMYFVLARAVEIPDSPNDSLSPIASFEAKAVAIIISTYAVWDIVSCRTDPTKLKQRLWASISCTIISWCLVFGDVGGPGTVWAVLLADFSLIALVFTFRAMKLHNFNEHDRNSWGLILLMLLLVLIFYVGSVKL